MELKDEKAAEIARYVTSPMYCQSYSCFTFLFRRKEITAARKKAALERQQFEEMKAKVYSHQVAYKNLVLMGILDGCQKSCEIKTKSRAK